MASLGGNHTVKLWTCSGCHETAILMTLGDCSQCGHTRCLECEVKSHLTTETERREENKKKDESTPVPSSTSTAGANEARSSKVEKRWRLEVVRESLSEEEVLQVMPIVTGMEDHPIFVLQEESDANLISHWNRVLPELSDLCLRDYSQLKISSIHLFRVGTDEFSSKPTIIVNTAGPLGANEKLQIQWTIAAFSDLALNSIRPSSVARITPPQLQLLFRQSRLRRSLHAPSLPPICKPRNRQFSSTPGTGASIGISGSFEDTATLGCYLLIDKTAVVLTVDHLIPKLYHRHNEMITHISQQDRFEILLSAMIQEISSVSSRTDHACNMCHFLVMHSIESVHNFAKASLMWFERGDATPGNSCPFYEALETLFKSNEWHEARRIAKIHTQSGPRSRALGNERREMDWAIFGVMPNDNSSFGLGEHIMFQHVMASETERPNELRLQPFKPGAFVRSLGRTSGHQIGRISTTTSAIFHGAYTTQEWTVIRRRETPLNEWVEGGVGVEGDSGALIVDEKTDAVYGMLWGRSGDGPATVTIFTPMQDILEDIQERAKTDQVQLLRGQQMPRPEKAENLETSIESVPITVSLQENEGNLMIEEGMASFSITRQSSADMRHPHSFERYRGRDGTDRSVPRTTPQQLLKTSKAVNGQVGTHISDTPSHQSKNEVILACVNKDRSQ